MNRQAQIQRLLNRLRAGEPAGELDVFGLLRPQALDARKALNEAVAASAERGPRADRLCIWLLGPYGGAKTNTLILMRAGLRGLARGNFRPAAASVDFKQDREATDLRGLQLTLFYSLALVGDSGLGDEFRSWAAQLVQRAQRRGDAGANAVALGLDVIFSLTGVPAPGAPNLIGRAFQWASRKWMLRESRLRSVIGKLDLGDFTAEEFVFSWFTYSLEPSPITWERFRRHAEALARNGRLFATLCRILEKAGYSSVTIFLDECDLLIGNQNLTGALESIRAAGADGRHDLDLNFVLAGVDRLSELENEVQYRGFVRRFVSAEDGPVIKAALSQPVLDQGPADDLSRVGNILAGLSPDAPAELQDSLRAIPGEVEHIRQSLANAGPVTWTRFWTAIFKKIDQR